MSALFATAQQPHSRDIFLNQKILPLDKLIIQQEGILAYKVINGTYLLGDILTDRHELVLSTQRHTVNYLFVIQLSKLGIVYLVIYVAHHTFQFYEQIKTDVLSTIGQLNYIYNK